MGKVFEYTFIQRRYKNGRYVHEKLLNGNLQQNVNQNHDERSPHIY